MASQVTGQTNSVHSQQIQDNNITYKYSVGFSHISPATNLQELFQSIQMEHIYINYIKPSVQEQKKYLSYSFIAHFSQEKDQEIFISSYLPFKIPKSEFSAIKKENARKDTLVRENRIIVSNVGINDLSTVWDLFSKYGRIQFMKIDFMSNSDEIFNQVQIVYQQNQSTINAQKELDQSTQWGQKIKVEIVPIPLPMKDQKVLFVKGIDINKSEQEVADFINKTFTPERVGAKFIKMDIISKHNIPNVVLYFDQIADINSIIEKTNELEFSGNSQKLKVQKYQSKQERVREQTEKEKNKPLNTLYLQGLKHEITQEMIYQEFQKLFPGENKKIKIFLKPATYSQIKSQDGSLTKGQTAIVELETEQEAEKSFLEIRKSTNFQSFFYPLFLKQNSFIQQFINRVLRTQFLNLRKEYFEKKQNQMRRMEEQKRRKVNINVMEQIQKPDFIDTLNPIFNPIDFNQLNLASELNQSTRTGTGNFIENQEEQLFDFSSYEKNLSDPYIQQFTIENYQTQEEEIESIKDSDVKKTIQYKLLKERLQNCYTQIPASAFEMIGMILNELENDENKEDQKESNFFSELIKQPDEQFLEYFQNDEEQREQDQFV